jgi:hypothetical protein
MYSNHGTVLDQLWIAVFQCVIQLLLATNKNIKHQYIAISAKVIHSAAEIVRLIEYETKESRLDIFMNSPVKLKIKELSHICSSEFPKKLMMSTRMAIGVWPPPEAIPDMIREASNLAVACKDLVLVANTLGYFPVLDIFFEINIQAFHDDEPDLKVPDSTQKLSSGLNYNEYKRENNLKLIESLSKGYDNQIESPDSSAYDPIKLDLAFSTSLNALLKQFVGSVTDLKQFCDNHMKGEYVNATSIVNERAEFLIEEILSNGMLKDMSEDIKISPAEILKFEAAGIKLNRINQAISIKGLYLSAIDEVREATQNSLRAGVVAASLESVATSARDMLHCTIPCVVAIKKLVILAKEASMKVRDTYSDERKKHDMWKKDCLQNEKVKQLFQMWESQVIGDTNPIYKKTNFNLTVEELALLEEPIEAIIDESAGKKFVKAGKLHQLVVLATSPTVTGNDELIADIEFINDFVAAVLMTHHSFTTSSELLDQFLKRYEITPPYGLSQRMFEIFLDKRVVQVRLKICNILFMWIKNHFEEDFVDNEPVLMRFLNFLNERIRDFVERKVLVDFETMGHQMLSTLDTKLREDGKPRQLPILTPEREKMCPKPLLPANFGPEPLTITNSQIIFSIDPLEFARQLTLFEFELFGNVQAYECLDQIWKSKRKKEAMQYRQLRKNEMEGSGVHISKLIHHTNQIGYWVATMILEIKDQKQRMIAIKWFVMLAQYCKELNNLTGVTTILAGLQMGPVERMKKTWGLLAEKFPKIYEHMSDLGPLISAKFQFANYRKYVKEMVPPAIPFLGGFQKLNL